MLLSSPAISLLPAETIQNFCQYVKIWVKKLKTPMFLWSLDIFLINVDAIENNLKDPYNFIIEIFG